MIKKLKNLQEVHVFKSFLIRYNGAQQLTKDVAVLFFAPAVDVQHHACIEHWRVVGGAEIAEVVAAVAIKGPVGFRDQDFDAHSLAGALALEDGVAHHLPTHWS